MELTQRTIDRVLFVQHQSDCTPSYLGERAEQRGMRVRVLDAQDTSDYPVATEADLVVSLGFGGSVLDPDVPFLAAERELLSEAVRAGIPVLGVCFGAQLLASVLGGRVYELPGGPDIGWQTLRAGREQLVSEGPWLVWHFDAFEPPPEGRELASNAVSSQAFRVGQHVGVQFHPEAAPDNVARWAATYRDSLLSLGIDPDELVDRTHAEQAWHRDRAYRLFDRVVQQAESAPSRARKLGKS